MFRKSGHGDFISIRCQLRHASRTHQRQHNDKAFKGFNIVTAQTFMLVEEGRGGLGINQATKWKTAMHPLLSSRSCLRVTSKVLNPWCIRDEEDGHITNLREFSICKEEGGTQHKKQST